MHAPDLALLFLRPLNQLRARYLVSGSVASIIYGEPRLTHDLDLVIFLNSDQIEALPKIFPIDQFYCPATEIVHFEAAREQRGHVNIIHHSSGFKADFYFAGRDPLHAWAFRRARTIPFMGEQITLAPPEYVIVRKLEFYREGGSSKHLRDIQLMLKMSSSLIDLSELEPLLAARGLAKEWSEVKPNP